MTFADRRTSQGDPVTKVLVTGSAGRLGRVLRRHLAKVQTIEPVYFIGLRSEPVSAEDIQVDIADRDSFLRKIERHHPDIIIHLASLTGAASLIDQDLTEAINVSSLRTIVEAAEFSSARIVFASSSAVYGDQYFRPVTELDSPRPTSPYGESKLRAEQILATATTKSVSLRIFNLFGPEFDESLIWRLQHSSEDRPVAIRGLDTFVRDYVHVDDVADALMKASVAEFTNSNTTMNIGSGHALSNRDLLIRLSATRRIHYKLAQAHASYSCADIALARRLLAFSPSHRV